MLGSAGKVEFFRRNYAINEMAIDGTKNTQGVCEVVGIRIYSEFDRSLIIGSIASSTDGNFYSKYVASDKILVQKNIGSNWYGYRSL